MKRNSGFTLLELAVAGVLVAVLTAIAMPQYQKAVEQQKRRAAIDVLRAIYAGEQTYWAQSVDAQNNFRYRSVNSTATDAAAEFNRIYTPLPTIDGVTFAVTAGGTGTSATFEAIATRSGSGSHDFALAVTQAWDTHTDPGPPKENVTTIEKDLPLGINAPTGDPPEGACPHDPPC